MSAHPRSSRRRVRWLLAGTVSGRWGYLLLTVGWVGLSAAAVGFIARSGAWTWQPLIVAAAFAPYLAAGGLAGGLILAICRAWVGASIAGLLVVCTIVLAVPLFVADGSAERGQTLTVLQANVRVGGANPARLVRQVSDHHVEVLTVDELTPAELSRLHRAGLDGLLPYHYAVAYPGGAGTGIWSRYPLTATARDDSFTFELVTARVSVPNTRGVALIAVHLLPPWPYPSRTWTREIHRLRARLVDAAAAGGTVIASGDFNATLDNAQLRGLATHGYHDAADQAGAGFLPTYPTDRVTPPLLTLDHIITRGAAATDVSTLTVPGSDHRGLLAEIHLSASSAH